MLEPPAIPQSIILGCLRSEWGLATPSLTFLPVGADIASAAYRAFAPDGSSYFVKLRLGPFDELAALLPAWLATQGVREIIAPRPTLSGRPVAHTPDFSVLVYPFVAGHDAYEGVLSDAQWFSFGRAVRQYQDAALPQALADQLPRERYDPKWRLALRTAMKDLDVTGRQDAVARRFVDFMVGRREQVLDLVDRTDRLAAALAADPPPCALCHTDLHPGNLLIRAGGDLFIVDWDAPLLAPRERDLMYPGGAQGFPGRPPSEEEALFYAGYGPVDVDVRALGYYRLERIIEDLAVISDQVLSPRVDTAGSGAADREQALGWAASNFEPGHTLEIADETYRRAAARLS